MLAHAELVQLYRSLADEPVLSVYLDTDQHDPAERSAWQSRLENEVSRLRKQMDGDETADAFEKAWSRVHDHLREYEDGFLPGRGLVAFATASELHHVARLPMAPPNMVRWEHGLRAAPYVRALKQARPVAIALVDSQRARIFTYRDAELEEQPSLFADTAIGDLSDSSTTRRSGRWTGRRGKTATEAAQRILEVSADRLHNHVAETLEELAGEDGFIIVGGTKESIADTVGDLSKGFTERAHDVPSLHVEMKDHELEAAVEEAASRLTETWQEALVRKVMDAARSGGNGCLGEEETIRALREHRVGTLLMSRSFINENPDLADRCVGTAFAQDAQVEELGGAPGSLLDEEAGGIAGHLRFRIRENDQDAA